MHSYHWLSRHHTDSLHDGSIRQLQHTSNPPRPIDGYSSTIHITGIDLGEFLPYPILIHTTNKLTNSGIPIIDRNFRLGVGERIKRPDLGTGQKRGAFVSIHQMVENVVQRQQWQELQSGHL